MRYSANKLKLRNCVTSTLWYIPHHVLLCSLTSAEWSRILRPFTWQRNCRNWQWGLRHSRGLALWTWRRGAARTWCIASHSLFWGWCPRIPRWTGSLEPSTPTLCILLWCRMYGTCCSHRPKVPKMSHIHVPMLYMYCIVYIAWNEDIKVGWFMQCGYPNCNSVFLTDLRFEILQSVSESVYRQTVLLLIKLRKLPGSGVPWASESTGNNPEVMLRVNSVKRLKKFPRNCAIGMRAVRVQQLFFASRSNDCHPWRVNFRVPRRMIVIQIPTLMWIMETFGCSFQETNSRRVFHWCQLAGCALTSIHVSFPVNVFASNSSISHRLHCRRDIFVSFQSQSNTAQCRENWWLLFSVSQKAAQWMVTKPSHRCHYHWIFIVRLKRIVSHTMKIVVTYPNNQI